MSRFQWFHTLWRSRVPLIGLISIALAITGEWLMRAQPDIAAPNPTLGVALLQVAALLVGAVAWVHSGLPRPKLPLWPVGPFGRKAAAPEALADNRQVEGPPPLPTRPRRTAPGHEQDQKAEGRRHITVRVAASVRYVHSRINATRRRAGWPGTLVGLLIVAGLAVWLGLLVREDYASPLALWLWVGMLITLAVTVAGMSIWPRGASLVPHDPTEPAIEDRVGRREWLDIGSILLVATLLRVWDLANLPNGIYIDEADQILRARLVNRGLPLAYSPYSFFSTDWWGVPTAYFWMLGQALNVFGDNQWGARLIHAFAGVGTVWFTYRIGRVAWSPRAGLLAGALLAVSDLAIHFSRSVTIATISQFGATACFYFVYKALKTRRPWDWLMAGLMAAVAYYGGYASAKVLPAFLALLGLYVLVRWGFIGIRRYLPGLILMGATFTLAMLPHIVFLAVKAPNAFGARTDAISIFGPQNAPGIQAIYGTDSWPTIVFRQYQESYKAFDVTREVGHFYPTGQPILPVPWAALWVLGTAYMVWRVGDVRYAALGIWLLSGLTGAALTTDTPSLQRVTGMIPTLALIPAMFVDRVLFGSLPLATRKRKDAKSPRLLNRLPTLATIGRVAALTLFVVASGVGNWRFYLDDYNRRVMYDQHNLVSGLERYQQTISFSLVGRYVQTLDKAHNMIAIVPDGAHYLAMPPTQFYLDGFESIEVGSLADSLPYISNKGKTINFVIYNSQAFALPILEQYFPGGEKVDILMPDGQRLAWVYRVDPGTYNAVHQTIARYGPAEQPLFERAETTLGTLGTFADGTVSLAQPPSWLNYPVRAEWRAGLVAPGYGNYRVSLKAPGGGELKIDGRTLLLAPPGSDLDTEVTLVLAKGLHQVELSGTLQSALGQVELRWASAGTDLLPIGRRFLWSGPQGVLQVHAYPMAFARDQIWYTTPQLSAYATPAYMARLDGFTHWRVLNFGFFAAPQLEIVWRGKFGVPMAGAYSFEAVTYNNVALSLWIDGTLVQTHGVAPIIQPPQMPMQLEAGQHTIELRVGMLGDNATLELYWQPPNSERALMPPTLFTPAEGGAWPVSEMPGLGNPEPGLLLP